MHFRKPSVKKEKVVDSEDDIIDPPVLGTTNPRKMRVDDTIALKDAIGLLPEGYRNVLVLHDVEGYEHIKVAKILGCSVGTSKSQLHKARLKLRKLLNLRRNPKMRLAA